uniref:Uncharacterized protein n=1 Tax=Arundo donax TaxID=35708 RepID=A0A0A9CHP8_ARUDO
MRSLMYITQKPTPMQKPRSPNQHPLSTLIHHTDPKLWGHLT